jgi:glycerophosphoryl diester phosphodiesterase
MGERALKRGTKTREILELALADLRRGLRDLLFVDLVCKGLGLIVFYPLLVSGARLLIAASGSEVVADQAILSFLLSPVGLVTLLAIGTIHFGLVGLELTALLACASRVAAGKRVTTPEALGFTLRRAPAVLSLAGRIWVRILAIVAPFLVAIGFIYKAFLTRFDINYYLSERPPVFMVSVALAAALVLVLALLLAPRLTGWAFALPVILFERSGARPAMALSIQRVREHRRAVRSALLIWLACSLLITAVAYGFVRAVALWVLPPFAENLPCGSAFLVIGTASA